jgi:hypothetical protein
VVGRSLSHADRTPCLSAPGSWPLRPDLAVPLSASIRGLGCGPCVPPLPPIGLTAADLFAGGEVSSADSRVRSPGTLTCARCPAVRSALDAGPEAYDNPAAVWWGPLQLPRSSAARGPVPGELPPGGPSRAGGAVSPGWPGGSITSRADLPFFRPDISPVGVDRASVMRCRRLLLVAVGGCCCCYRCCQPLVLFPISTVSPAPRPRPRRRWDRRSRLIPATRYGTAVRPVFACADAGVADQCDDVHALVAVVAPCSVHAYESIVFWIAVLLRRSKEVGGNVYRCKTR